MRRRAWAWVLGPAAAVWALPDAVASTAAMHADGPRSHASGTAAWPAGRPQALAPAPVAAQAAETPRVEVERPRDFGYRVGDLVVVRATVAVPRAYEIEPQALRSPEGADWLEQREVRRTERVRGHDRRYELEFVYQLFYVGDPGLHRLEIPARSLRFRSADGEAVLRATLPAVPLTLTALTDSLAPPAPDLPVPAPSDRAVRAAAAALVVLLALWAGWGAVVWRRRRVGVFAQARRAVARARSCAEAALAVHRALDRCAGRTVLPGDLDALGRLWPPAGALRADLERFFQLSETLFYRNHGRLARGDAECLRWLRGFADRLARAERGNGRLRPPARARAGGGATPRAAEERR
jgi:mxaA protein